MSIAVVRNPSSGTAPDTEALAHALRIAGITADILDTPASGFDEWIDRVAADHDIVAAAGGDGTVSSVAAGVARAGKTLAVIPTGTLNHFARDAGIPIELDASVALIRTGRPRGVDAGFVNDQFFLNNVSLGNYPRMVSERDALEERGHSKRIAGVIAVARTWWHLRNVTATITIDDQTLRRRSPLILIGNGSYLLSGFALGRRENISDCWLSLYVAPPTGRLGALSLPLRAVVGTLDNYEQFETFSAQQITIALSRARVLTGIDGEVREFASPLRLKVKAAALQVVLP